MNDENPFSKLLKVAEQLRGATDHFERRRARALQRLATNGKAGWYFGIIGMECEVPSFDFADQAVVLEEVEEPPGEVELARALTQPHLFGAIGRYSHSISHQLRIVPHDAKDEFCFTLAWWVISLLRVRTQVEFLVPAATNYSWSVIAGLSPNTCNAQFIEDIPTATKLDESYSVSKEDLIWVSDNLILFSRMLEIQNFRLAVECLTTHQHQTSNRMMIAMLWSGIESLFTIHAELTFRLSTFIAALLEPPGARRRDLYARVKKLYAVRSKAVHGAKLTKQQIEEHVIEVRSLLSRLLCLMVEKGHVFTEQQVEDLLFGVPMPLCETTNAV